jgi:hypothetical protein
LALATDEAVVERASHYMSKSRASVGGSSMRIPWTAMALTTVHPTTPLDPDAQFGRTIQVGSGQRKPCIVRILTGTKKLAICFVQGLRFKYHVGAVF